MEKIYDSPNYSSGRPNYFYCSKHMSCLFLLYKIPLVILADIDDTPRAKPVGEELL